MKKKDVGHWTEVVEELSDREVDPDRVDRILVIDDAKGQRDLLIRLLELDGHQVTAVADGASALESLGREPTDLVLLDVEMPKMDGLQTLAHLKKDPELAHIPVVMLSASTDLDLVVQCIEAGAEDYLPKPFNRTLLKARIGASLRRKRLADSERSLIERLQAEIGRSDRLLRNILPDSVIARLRQGQSSIADGYNQVSVLFADVVGFTTLASKATPGALVHALHGIVSRFDALADRHGAEKIKTIGDAYMAAAGLPEERADHAETIAKLALDMRTAVEGAEIAGQQLQLRIGIHSGPVVAGVTGTRKFTYDLWGQTVNLASRMESQGIPGAIQITEATRRLLPKRFATESRGVVEIKGIGPIQTHLLLEPGAGS